MRLIIKFLYPEITIFILCFLFLALLAGCKKEIVPALPGGTPATGLNFYPASDVTAAYAKNSQLTAIYVDQYNSRLPTSNGSGIPTFSYLNNGTAIESPIPAGDVFSFIRYNAGSHHLMFTDTTNTVILDTTMNFPAKTFTSLYFTDAQATTNAQASYKMIAVEENRDGTPSDKTGVRFVHLSADAGDLTAMIQKADGTQTPVLPGAFSFLQATPYQYLETSAVVSGLLRFTLMNASSGASVVTGVPFYPGHSYVIVISGFLNDQQREIPAGKNPDGSRKYTSITVRKNLRATVRRSY